MKKNVPEHLKKKALRKLWLTNPILANLDGMNEYDEDFTIATSALEEFATNYVVGKGFKGQFKPQTDNEDLDISEQSNALKTSSIRVNEQNTKVSYNKKPISNNDNAAPALLIIKTSELRYVDKSETFEIDVEVLVVNCSKSP